MAHRNKTRLDIVYEQGVALGRARRFLGDTLLDILTQRYGPLLPERVDKLNAMNFEELGRLCDKVRGINPPEDFGLQVPPAQLVESDCR